MNPYAIYVSCLSLLCCKAELLALLCLIFSCVIGTCPYGDLGQVWYLIVSFPDLCLHLNFHSFFQEFMSECYHSRHTNFMVNNLQIRERSGSVVECLTRDRRVAGSSLIGVTALWSLSKTHLS